MTTADTGLLGAGSVSACCECGAVIGSGDDGPACLIDVIEHLCPAGTAQTRLASMVRAHARLVSAVRMHVLFLTRRTQPCDCVSADADCAGCVEHYEAGEAAFEELLAALEQAEQAVSAARAETPTSG